MVRTGEGQDDFFTVDHDQHWEAVRTWVDRIDLGATEKEMLAQGHRCSFVGATSVGTKTSSVAASRPANTLEFDCWQRFRLPMASSWKLRPTEPAGGSVVWLFEGHPDRPAWLRRWFLGGRAVNRAKRRIRRGKEPFAGDLGKSVGKASRRSGWRRTFANIVTEPGLTIAAELAGGVLVALQVDRLTDSTRPGSLATAVFGVGLIVLGVFASRSRAASEAKLRDRNEDHIDRLIVCDVTGAVQGTAEDVVERLTVEVRQLRDALDARTDELRVDVQRVHDRFRRELMNQTGLPV